MNPSAWMVVAGIVGAMIGSFLNVVIWRLPRGESLVRPPSRCPACGTPIRWFDNVPVLAWVYLLGHCRSCRAPISPRYPFVEALTALLFVWVAWRHPLPDQAAVAASKAALLSALLALAFIDLDTRLLPDAITKPLILAGLVVSFFVPALHPDAFPDLRNRNVASFLEAFLGAASGAALILVVRFLGTMAFRKEAMGLGDAKLLAAIGAFVPPIATLWTLLLASLVGSVLGALFVAVRRARPAPLSGRIGDAEFSLARLRPASKRRPARIEAVVSGPAPAAGSAARVSLTIPKDDAWFDSDVAVRAEAVVLSSEPRPEGTTLVSATFAPLPADAADAVTTFHHARGAVPFGPFLAIGGAVLAMHGDVVGRFVTVTWPQWAQGLLGNA